jgi:small subunit ribosomal protein S1
LFGKISNLTDYGAFVEIEPGIEGLVHVSEMDWTNRNVHPGKVVQLGDEVEIMILEIDEDRRRISLGMKQCTPNPWQEFEQSASKGDKVSGSIKSITDFGIFIGLPGGIDGLVHTSDLSWTEQGEDAVRNYKKGDEVEAVVLAIDVERERISLGVKQLSEDPMGGSEVSLGKGSVISATISSVEDRGLTLDIDENVKGFIKSSDLSRDRDVRLDSFSAGQTVEAMVMGVDKKTRVVSLSIKAKEASDEAEAIKKHAADSDSQSAGTTNLGALLKAKLDNAED